MKTKPGVIGVLALMLALTGGILGSWALSTDVNDVERTDYRQLTEITPLFGSENAPQYITYNPSSNYTGYYTDDSVINGIRYFDGVDYGTSLVPNVYKLNLAPTSSTSVDDYDLSGATPDTTKTAHYWAVSSGVTNISSVNVISLENLVAGLNLSAYNRFVITNSSAVSDYTDSGSFITFTTSNNLNHDNNYKNPELTGNVVVESWFTVPADEIQSVILAVDYDVVTGRATTYYDVDMTQKDNTYKASEVYLLWGGSGTFVFGDSIDYTAYEFPVAAYMDPTKGVELL